MRDIVYQYSSGGVILREGKVLTIYSPSRNSIGLPKGTIDEGESPEQAAVREVKEETGYDTKILKKLSDFTYEFDWTDGKHHIKTVTYYLMQLVNDLPPIPNLQPGEDFEIKWLDVAEALELFTFSEPRDALRLALTSVKATL